MIQCTKMCKNQSEFNVQQCSVNLAEEFDLKLISELAGGQKILLEIAVDWLMIDVRKVFREIEDLQVFYFLSDLHFVDKY